MQVSQLITTLMLRMKSYLTLSHFIIIISPDNSMVFIQILQNYYFLLM